MKIKIKYSISALLFGLTLSACNPSKNADSEESYVVKFYNGQVLLYETQVNKGETAVYIGDEPTKNDDENASYSFSGWNKELENVTQNLEVYAEFEEHPYDFTVKNSDEWEELFNLINFSYSVTTFNQPEGASFIAKFDNDKAATYVYEGETLASSDYYDGAEGTRVRTEEIEHFRHNVNYSDVSFDESLKCYKSTPKRENHPGPAYSSYSISIGIEEHSYQVLPVYENYLEIYVKNKKLQKIVFNTEFIDFEANGLTKETLMSYYEELMRDYRVESNIGKYTYNIFDIGNTTVEKITIVHQQ